MVTETCNLQKSVMHDIQLLEKTHDRMGVTSAVTCAMVGSLCTLAFNDIPVPVTTHG